MLSPVMTNLLNEQIARELYSVNLYRQMAAWCDHQGLIGSAAFLDAQARDEDDHFQRFYRYVRETGSLAVIAAIPAPPSSWPDIRAVFQDALVHEQQITRAINALYKAAFEEGDFATVSFLQWFTTEQHEEERLLRTVHDKLRIIGADPKGLYWIDKEIGKLAERTAGS